MDGTILTDVGIAKLLVASPLNPIVITEIAVGDGSGGYPTLTSGMTALTNEVWRGDATAPVKEGAGLDVLKFEGIVPRSVGGFTVREIAIFDEDGDMIAIGQTSALLKPVPDATNGLTLTVRLRVQLSNTAETSLFITESISYDHRNLTFRDEPNAHPANTIDLDQGRTVQAMNDTSLVVSTVQVLQVGEDNYITLEDTFTLPSTTGLAVGSKVYISKKGSINPTISVNGGNSEQVLIGSSSDSYIPYDGFIYSINAGIVLRFDGTDWELM